ncbi:hypothetical protein GF337_02490 [candidate division KSB1 bacterium]|nr:hypothetical protein [candidate division KSB1 bacterium]
MHNVKNKIRIEFEKVNDILWSALTVSMHSGEAAKGTVAINAAEVAEQHNDF